MIYKMNKLQYRIRRQTITHKELLNELNIQLGNHIFEQVPIKVEHNDGRIINVDFNETRNIITDVVTD